MEIKVKIPDRNEKNGWPKSTNRTDYFSQKCQEKENEIELHLEVAGLIDIGKDKANYRF